MQDVTDASVNTGCKLKLVFMEKCYSFRADSILKSDGDFTSNWKFPVCISLLHEPDNPSCANSRKELRRNCSPIGLN